MDDLLERAPDLAPVRATEEYRRLIAAARALVEAR